jgi:hypothetical protein
VQQPDPAKETLNALATARATIDRLSAPSEPGIYALFLAGRTSLPGLTIDGGEPIYIGLSTNLAQREFATHFSVRSGFSTIRRSLGALLKDELRLRARARGRGLTEQDISCYCFTPDGEERLTIWMRSNVHVSVQPFEDYRSFEKRLIALAEPPLNLTGWKNPDAAEIKRLRKVCADEARLSRNLSI